MRTATPVSCKSCGVDFHLYPDPDAHCVMSIICHCGAENEWTFPPQPSLPSRYRAFGMKAVAVPRALEAFRVAEEL